MKFWSNSFQDGAVIPGEFAFCVIDPATHVTLSANKNPHLAWSELPGGTRSLVLVCHDPDVPSRGDDVNQEGRTVPADLPRVDFFHWVLVDLPAHLTAIEAGTASSGVTPRGKSGPQIGNPAFAQARHGLNDYTGWFAGDPDMAGDYCGYDGPCPPWNDAIAHRYVFTLFALDVERLPVEGKFSGAQVRAAMAGHILAQAQWTGTYSLNPALVK
ncbi:YbhB/YbcL family Raf kinase inhibitor-like protein [Janthinobacterium sp. 17J80-10]|uniref:YbhB/YbcL family Raf kinase inhibitor-like protein n=1 Tax=Janthinobacterium sp. 17J80-10 TaxID=2497863 RepID=UPI0010058D84|nr:YbhB/YbcL family Raf kinase inhibitor-like protein [Janthinobacterium sp. 17J80-10]QAU35756.1 YbhB/YbcL family Raf kinase inhibitor-like protein [Janthinobacterium sp. 17J80-10]